MSSTTSPLALGLQWLHLLSIRDFTTIPTLYASPSTPFYLSGDPAYFAGAGWSNASFINTQDARLFNPFANFSTKLHHAIADNSSVWLEFTEYGEFNDSRPAFENTLAIAFTVEDGKFVSAREYVDTATVQRLDEELGE